MEKSTLPRGPIPQEYFSRFTDAVLRGDFRDGDSPVKQVGKRADGTSLPFSFKLEDRTSKQMDFKDKQRLVLERRKQLEKQATSAEIEMKKRLTQMVYEYIFQKGFIAGDNFCICDFYIPKLKLVIEVDGAYHLTVGKERDKWKNEYLTKFRKFAVLRISNGEVWKMPRKALEALIKSCQRGMVTYSRDYFKPKANL